MSNYQNQRRLNAVLGVLLTVIAAVAVALLGTHLLATPVLAIQVLMLAAAGTCNLIAAINGVSGWAWYRWSGLGNILLGLSLPLAFVGTTWNPVLLVVTGLGGLSLAAMGVDLLAFHGTYTRQTPLNQYN